VTRGGEKLTISYERSGDGFSGIHLEGGAAVICEGNLYIKNLQPQMNTD
jgi:hypothetical protein